LVLVGAVERVIEAGRIRPQEPTPAATQILSATHGFVLLAMSGFSAERSLAAAIKARASQDKANHAAGSCDLERCFA
jgi:hypothetical protein